MPLKSKLMIIPEHKALYIRKGAVSIVLIIIVGAIVIFSSGFLIGKTKLGGLENGLGRLTGLASQTFRDILRQPGERPVLEVKLKEDTAATTENKTLNPQAANPHSVFKKNLQNPSKQNSEFSKDISGSSTQPSTEEISSTMDTSVGSTSFTSASSAKEIIGENPIVSEPAALADCDFSSGGEPNHQVLFNEIAWMGGASSSNDEWLELKNNSGKDIHLGGWRILSADEKMEIIFEEKDFLPTNGFFLLERTDDDSAPGVPADKIYSGALSNSGEWLKIFDADCKTIDEVNAADGWPAGDNSVKQTMERNKFNLGWQTSVGIGGTPKKENSSGIPPTNQSSQSTSLQNNSQTTSSQNSIAATSLTLANQTQSAGNIVISEIMAGIDGNSNYEFVEIYNPGANEIDLTGWTMKKKSSSGSESSLVSASRLESKKIPPNKHFLLVNEAVSSTIASADVYWPKSYTLAYASNSVAVYDSGGAKIGEVGWSEIPAGSSYERQPLSGNQFIIEPNPNPQNSGQ